MAKKTEFGAKNGVKDLQVEYGKMPPQAVDLEEAVAIFENINQGGKRLTLFDLVHASVWSQDFDLREQIESFNDSPAIKLFGGISEETFTQSLSLNAKGSCLKLNQLHLTNEDCKK